MSPATDRPGTDRGTAQLSQRAQRLLARPALPEYLREHFERSVEPFDPVTRPDGYLALCVAENPELADVLLARLGAVADVPARVLAYDAMIGSLPFRRQLGAFLGRTALGRTFDAAQIAVVAGAGSVLELLFHALGDPGDGVLVPTPGYPGFWPDLQLRDELAIVPVPCSAENGFRVTTELLEASLRSADRRIRALLFTSPSNPVGSVYSAAELDRILAWGAAAGIHLVFDEVYALSVHQGVFTSVAQRLATLGDRIHLLWAFSKDFGASGLRCGVLVSENAALLAALDTLAYWECCSGHTQFLLGEVVSDRPWVDAYLSRMRAGLARRYRGVTQELERHGIRYLPAAAGFFVLLDLRGALREPSWEAEDALWRRLLDAANLNLTPGAACRAPQPGWFRLCFGAVDDHAARTAVERLAGQLQAAAR